MPIPDIYTVHISVRELFVRTLQYCEIDRNTEWIYILVHLWLTAVFCKPKGLIHKTDLTGESFCLYNQSKVMSRLGKCSSSNIRSRKQSMTLTECFGSEILY